MRRAIVTGGTRGIGLAIAGAIIAEGGRAAIVGLDAGHLAQAVSTLGAADPARVVGIQADVRDPDAVRRFVDEATAKLGGLDTLINNAGVGAFASIASTSDADWRRVLDTNLSGAFYCSRAAIPKLKAEGGGWIINIASLAGRHPFAEGGAYCASKAGLIALTESLMLEVRAENIRVSVVLPGSVATEFSSPSHMQQGAASWKLAPDDVALAVMDLLRHPSRSLPSRIEIRPARTRPA